MYMRWDKQMFEYNKSKSELRRTNVYSIGLHEELSQVRYIFCDKTGTLTQNELIFRGMSLHSGFSQFFRNNVELKNFQY